jgi:hypothetical protein
MKIRGMDGPIDLYIYRPIGFVIAWLLSFTGIGPNAVTLISILLGAAAGACALPGTPSAFLLCAILFQISNCFDCADGQLARLTGRYSLKGRVLDGAADYAVNLCVYLSSLAGLIRAGHGPIRSLLVVAAGGAAMAFSCLFYDRAITRYAKLVEGEAGSAGDEGAQALESAASSKGLLRVLWKTYARYLRLQGAQGGREGGFFAALEGEEQRRAYAERQYPLLMVWSFAGPSAHVLYFLALAAIGRIEFFFAAAVLIAAGTLVLLAVQKLLDQRYSKYI